MFTFLKAFSKRHESGRLFLKNFPAITCSALQHLDLNETFTTRNHTAFLPYQFISKEAFTNQDVTDLVVIRNYIVIFSLFIFLGVPEIHEDSCATDSQFHRESREASQHIGTELLRSKELFFFVILIIFRSS